MLYYYLKKGAIAINQLSKFVDNFINAKGIKKVWLAEKLDISQQLLYRLQNKKNFNIDDANRILNVVGYQIEYDIIPNKETDERLKITLVYKMPGEIFAALKLKTYLENTGQTANDYIKRLIEKDLGDKDIIVDINDVEEIVEGKQSITGTNIDIDFNIL